MIAKACNVYMNFYANVTQKLVGNKLQVFHPNFLCNKYTKFLNQACTGRRLVCAWFLRIAFVHEHLYTCVCVCLSVCPRGY